GLRSSGHGAASPPTPIFKPATLVAPLLKLRSGCGNLRCSSVEEAARSGARIDITTQPERPAPLQDNIANGMLAQ
ncbi:hypothetical protein, partial [Roseinatronobacter sp.]|uniref:hypothetical protein n=1 Tax=Roseinatronobacter sp. TaxID=1945755 RepID=UPI003F6EAB25